MDVDEAVKLVAKSHQLLHDFVTKMRDEHVKEQLTLRFQNRSHHPAFEFKFLRGVPIATQIDIIASAITEDDGSFNLLRLEAWMTEYQWILHFCRMLPPNIMSADDIPSDRLAEALRVMFSYNARSM